MKMNNRNFNQNNKQNQINNRNFNQNNQNQMPMNLNTSGIPGGTPFNAMANMHSRNGNEFPQQLRQLNNNPGPIFPRNQGEGMKNGPSVPLFQNKNNCIMEPFNRGELIASGSGVSQFNRSPDRGPGLPLNRSPVRGPGLQMNCSPDRRMMLPFNRMPDREPWSLCNRIPDRGGPELEMNASSELHPGYQFFNNIDKVAERESGFLQGAQNQSPERTPDFFRRQLSRSPERGSQGHQQRSRSRSAERVPRRVGRPSGSTGRVGRPSVSLRRVGRPSGTVRRRTRRGRGRSPESEKLNSSHGLRSPIDERSCNRFSGARMKWFKRYMDQGFSAKEALLMIKEPVQPAANFRRGPQQQQLSVVKPPMSLKDNNSGENETGDKSAEPNGLEVCLVPVGFPKESLSHQEKLDLEEGVLQEVLKAGSYAGAPLRFSSIQFKPGFLKISCANQATAVWLLGTGPQLSSYLGRPIEPISGNFQPPWQMILISVSLPRAAGKSDEYLLGLLKSQNQFNTNLWKIIKRKDIGGCASVILGIDPQSADDIAANNHLIFYRYGQVPVSGLQENTNHLSARSSSLQQFNSARSAQNNLANDSPSPSKKKSRRGSRNPSSAKSPSPTKPVQIKSSPVSLCIDCTGSDDDNP